MIDDHLKNLDNFNGVKLLFTATHNTNVNSKKYTRVNGWHDVKQLLIEQNEWKIIDRLC